MNSLYQTRTPEETMQLGRQLAERLGPGSVVLLIGDLGSGKTHFTKGLAQGLGIEKMIKSPTFTYVNVYKITSGEGQAKSEEPNTKKLHADRSTLTTLHHYDLYRLNPGDSFYSIGLEDTLQDPYAINIIEWADRLQDHLPKNYIWVEMKAGGPFHEIQIRFHDSEVVPLDKVRFYWEKWLTPVHVKAHCQKVSEVALKIAHAYVKHHRIIDLTWLQTACLLHDMARVCDFTDLNRSKFSEEISEEKWQRWIQLRERFSGQNHSDIAAQDLMKDGYLKTAESIRLHHSTSLLNEPEKFDQLETALIYYADKRVMHDQVVSLAERFEDGRQRYGQHDDKDKKKLYQQVEQACLELEEKLFSGIDLKPQDIR